MTRMERMAPSALARTAGVLYILEGLTSVSGALLVPGTIMVRGDVAATAGDILGNAPLYLLGVTASLVSVAFHTALTVFLYYLFRPVGRVAALLFASIGLMAIVLQAVSALLQLPALIILGGGGGVVAFSAEETQSLARVFLTLRAQAFNFYLGFFGFRCAAIGYLISQSSFMPRLIGVSMALTGLGYLTFLWPPLANSLAPFNLAIAAPGELSFVLWLVLAGVNSELWKQQAKAAAEECRRALA
jgi:hypothetical protein